MSSHIEFFSRGDPEKVAEWRAGEVSIEDFMEAGWTQAKSPPPLLPAQLSSDLFGVDITENAVQSFNAAAEAYGESHTDGDALRRGVLHLFHALELILKVRLEQLSGRADTTHLNNTAVLSALNAMGVTLATDDLDAIANLRRLRNKLQHGGARYGYREVRVLLARTFFFIDAFFKDEFGEWIGEIAEQPGWSALLTIRSIKKNAENEVAKRIRLATFQAQCTVERCPDRKQKYVVREGKKAGFCLYCRRVPRAA
ncbi:MAG: hypothetical protein ACTHJ3_02120 [Pararhizobium sp.]